MREPRHTLTSPADRPRKASPALPLDATTLGGVMLAGCDVSQAGLDRDLIRAGVAALVDLVGGGVWHVEELDAVRWDTLPNPSATERWVRERVAERLASEPEVDLEVDGEPSDAERRTRGALRYCGVSHFSTCPDAAAHRKGGDHE